MYRATYLSTDQAEKLLEKVRVVIVSCFVSHRDNGTGEIGFRRVSAQEVSTEGVPCATLAIVFLLLTF